MSTTLHEDSIDPTMYNGEIDRTKPIKNVTVKKFMPPKEDSKPSKKNKRAKTTVVQSAIATDSTNNSKIFGAVIEEMASFPGGRAACMKYIADNLRYPSIQGDCSIQGKVVVAFTVNEDGSLSDIKAMRNVSPALDSEAVRVVKSMPKWIPAKQNGKAVKSKCTLPVYIHVQ